MNFLALLPSTMVARVDQYQLVIIYDSIRQTLLSMMLNLNLNVFCNQRGTFEAFVGIYQNLPAIFVKAVWLALRFDRGICFDFLWPATT